MALSKHNDMLRNRPPFAGVGGFLVVRVDVGAWMRG